MIREPDFELLPLIIQISMAGHLRLRLVLEEGVMQDLIPQKESTSENELTQKPRPKDVA